MIQELCLCSLIKMQPGNTATDCGSDFRNNCMRWQAFVALNVLAVMWWEVLRHSAALSCWHRKRVGLGAYRGQSQAELQLVCSVWISSSLAHDYSWQEIKPVQASGSMRTGGRSMSVKQETIPSKTNTQDSQIRLNEVCTEACVCMLCCTQALTHQQTLTNHHQCHGSTLNTYIRNQSHLFSLNPLFKQKNNRWQWKWVIKT